ncbi:uncharacterized protein LOC130553046 [Triplophysa rosa]|uniref:uncharacterized protein LOC130553046 n=1 Tax=Triplophysa rosa TaxID=992332 RepID=UPI0025461A92|nr:uncharacterized protein LOC130553046 [Triplophysa rosa]
MTAVKTTKSNTTGTALKTTAKTTTRSTSTTKAKHLTTTPVTKTTTSAPLNPPTAKEGFIFVTFRIMRIFIQDYYDKTSSAYKILERNITTELNRGYKNKYPQTFLRCIIISVWPGSVGLTTQLIFQNQSVVPNITNVKESLSDTVNASIVYLDIIPSSIVAYHQSLVTTTIAPKITTPLTSSQPSTRVTSGSAMARSRPTDVVIFLLPITLINFFLLELKVL